MTITIRPWDDPTTWNQFVSSLPEAHFQQSWEWGELAALFGSRVVRLAALRDGAPIGGMQVFANPLGRTGRTYLYVPRGPAVRRASVELLGPLLDAARLYGGREDAIGIRLEPNVPDCDPHWKGSLGALGLRPTYPPMQPRSSWVLDVTPEPDSLLAAMKQKTRYNIRLAGRKGVEVVEGGEADFDGFYELYRRTAARDDFYIQPKAFYRRMFSLYREAGLFCLLLARYRGQLLAATTLLRFGQTCWYVHGASSDEHRNLMAPYLLQWEGIQWARRQGCALYDFRAIPDVLRDDQDMYGVYRFKEGFGGRKVTTLHTFAAPYRMGVFGLWQLYFAGRFAFQNWGRRRKGLTIRQFA
ncbi:MAG: peptidoglycan bridge formation glycyltransferase FemA/FemB family protein [Chloroflexi bacterium]|nr:peptidoglycan bridge formation glycyltransferase FemA/FemB family protein [Chloroflexota bacterium]